MAQLARAAALPLDALDGGFEEAERSLYSRRGDRLWLLGYILLFLAPSLILFSIGLSLVGSTWLGLWVVFVLFAIRAFPRIQAGRTS